MARQISAEKQQMFLNEDVRTLLPRMAVPTIVARLITANTITDTASIERRSKRTAGDQVWFPAFVLFVSQSLASGRPQKASTGDTPINSLRPSSFSTTARIVESWQE